MITVMWFCFIRSDESNIIPIVCKREAKKECPAEEELIHSFWLVFLPWLVGLNLDFSTIRKEEIMMAKR